LFASKNNGNFNFTLYSSDAVKYGGWLTMDAGDFNGDEKQDLMLGNFQWTPYLKHRLTGKNSRQFCC